MRERERESSAKKKLLEREAEMRERWNKKE